MTAMRETKRRYAKLKDDMWVQKKLLDFHTVQSGLLWVFAFTTLLFIETLFLEKTTVCLILCFFFSGAPLWAFSESVRSLRRRKRARKNLSKIRSVIVTMRLRGFS